MQKTLSFRWVTLFILLIFLLSGVSEAEESPDPCANIDIAWIRKHTPVPPAEIIYKRPVNGLCEVVLSLTGNIVPLYCGKDFIIAGEMLQNRRQITQQSLELNKVVIDQAKLKAEAQKKAIRAAQDQKTKADIDKLEPLVAFEYTPPKASGRHLYFITDPFCGYCTRAGKQMKRLSDKYQVTVKGIIDPIFGDRSDKKAKEAICKKMGMDDYLQNGWKEDLANEMTCPEAEKMIPETKRLLASLGVKAVPVFIFGDGTRVVGADMLKLEQKLQTMTRK